MSWLHCSYTQSILFLCHMFYSWTHWRACKCCPDKRHGEDGRNTAEVNNRRSSTTGNKPTEKASRMESTGPKRNKSQSSLNNPDEAQRNWIRTCFTNADIFERSNNSLQVTALSCSGETILDFLSLLPYLAAPSASVESERLFSTASNIFGWKEKSTYSRESRNAHFSQEQPAKVSWVRILKPHITHTGDFVLNNSGPVLRLSCSG